MFAAVPAAMAVSSHAAPAASSATTVSCSVNSATYTVSNSPPSGFTKKVLSLSWRAVDDEDSGFFGYWAMDTYNVGLTVWENSTGYYYAIQTFSGDFAVPQGALSPGSGTPEPASGYGTLTGVINGTITNAETFHKGTLATSGNLGDINYGGTTSDILLGSYSNGQTGDSSSYNWYTTYFTPADPSNANFAYGWAFTYVLNSMFTSNAHGSTTSMNTWCNWPSSSGDILTATED